MKNLDEIIKKLKKERFFREKAEGLNSLEVIDEFNDFLILKVNGKNLYPYFVKNEEKNIKEFLKNIITERQNIKAKKGIFSYKGKNIFQSEIENLKIVNADTSNTLLVGNTIFVKFYRELSEKAIREILLLKSLDSCYKNKPDFIGGIYYRLKEKYPLFLIQKKIENSYNLWDYLLNSDLMDEKKIFKSIGKITAGLHRCFLDKKSYEITQKTTISILKDIKSIGVKISNFLKKDEIESILKILKDVQIKKCRYPLSKIHGDYHLGQIVISNKKLYVLDFEGEPIGKKGEFYPILYDVAGMIRSISYLTTFKNSTFFTFKELALIFIKQYFKDMEIIPTNEDIKILGMMLLRKNLYEILYELNNRPHFLHIPLKGLSQLSKILSTLFNYNWA